MATYSFQDRHLIQPRAVVPAISNQIEGLYFSAEDLTRLLSKGTFGTDEVFLFVEILLEDCVALFGQIMIL